MSTINISFYYQYQDGETSVQFHLPHVPRVGEHVVLIWSNYSTEPYDTKLEGKVESVSWEINSRRTHDKTNKVYAHVRFEGVVETTPWKPQ